MNPKHRGQIMRDRLACFSNFYVEAEKQAVDDPAHKKYWTLKVKEAADELDRIAGEMMDAD